MMMKSGLEFFYFEIPLAALELLLPSAKKNCPEKLNQPSKLASISEVEFQNKKTTFHHHS